MDAIPRMTKEELRERRDFEDLKVLDVRKGSDYEASAARIPGAVRESPNEVDFWMEGYSREEPLVLYCA